MFSIDDYNNVIISSCNLLKIEFTTVVVELLLLWLLCIKNSVDVVGS